VAKRLVFAATIHGVQTTAAFRGGPFEHAKIQIGDQSLPASTKATAGLSTMGVLVDYFPLENWGWHTALSIGLGATSLINQAAKDSSYYSTSVGGTLASGYSWHLTGDWSIGVDLVASATGRATLKEDEKKAQSDTDYRLSGFELCAMSSILYF
jgi:hypothetical protein